MIDIRIGTLMPELELRLPADESGLPVIRQVLRSLGESVGAAEEPLEDAELAVTEASANAIEHAYSDGGDVEIEMRPGAKEIMVVVRDHGRGMPRGLRAARSRRRGYGLSMIEGIATTSEIRATQGGGTEVVMCFEVSDTPLDLPIGPHALDPTERVVRRVVGVVAAQQDLPSDRMIESLLVAELVARHAPAHLVGSQLQVRLDRLTQGFELSVGPLVDGGADAVVGDTEVAVVGSVVDRLVDEVRAVRNDSDGEHLSVKILGGGTRAAA